MTEPMMKTVPQNQDDNAEAGPGAGASNAATSTDRGSRTKESRWELGVFARKVTTESATPPDWDAGPQTSP